MGPPIVGQEAVQQGPKKGSVTTSVTSNAQLVPDQCLRTFRPGSLTTVDGTVQSSEVTEGMREAAVFLPNREEEGSLSDSHTAGPSPCPQGRREPTALRGELSGTPPLRASLGGLTRANGNTEF